MVHLFYSKDAQGTARVTAKSLLEACLRMKPDRIFLAEVRGDECFYFVRLAASGHPGSITSVHAGSCALAFEQMALMIRESGAGGGLRMDEIKWLLGIVIDVIVQFDRDERGRFISEIVLRAAAASGSAAGTSRGRQRMSSVAALPFVGLADRPQGRGRRVRGCSALPALACAAVYLSAALFLRAEQGRPAAGAVRQHRRTTGTLYADDPRLRKKLHRLDRRVAASACWSCCPRAWSPRRGRAGRCMAMRASPTRPKSRARA